MYTEADYRSLNEVTVPEIQRSNLAPVILQLKALGIDNVVRFDFLTPPPAELVIRGLELLYSLGALDDYAKLTRPLMQAKDFITNVSSTFTSAQAQVVFTDPDPTKPKYTIRGVRPRSIPVDLRGRPYLKCLWRTPAPTTNGHGPGVNGHDLKHKDSECDFSVMRAEEVIDHVMAVHFNIHTIKETGKYDVSPLLAPEAGICNLPFQSRLQLFAETSFFDSFSGTSSTSFKTLFTHLLPP